METELENILISRYKKDMIVYINSHPEDFEKLVNLALTDKQPYSWRAAWLLSSCIKNNDIRLRKYTKKIIYSLSLLGYNQQRELLKILYLVDIDEDYEGYLFDISLSIWERICSQPSVRLNAFKIILKIVRKHPELKHELEHILGEEHLENLSPGVKHSINKMIKSLKLPIIFDND